MNDDHAALAQKLVEIAAQLESGDLAGASIVAVTREGNIAALHSHYDSHALAASGALNALQLRIAREGDDALFGGTRH